MKKLSLALVVFGACLLVGGFLYDVMFAGIPYQDPTPQMQARYDHHAAIAGKMMWAGAITLFTGTVALIASKAVSKKEPIQPPQTTTGSSAPDRV